jgi:hypothetical protein
MRLLTSTLSVLLLLSLAAGAGSGCDNDDSTCACDDPNATCGPGDDTGGSDSGADTTATTDEGSPTDEGSQTDDGPCVPQCTIGGCGPDGCGGTCGSCDGGQVCTAQGECVGACLGGADAAVINTTDVKGIFASCGAACYVGTDAEVSACVTECMLTDTELSEACAGCFAYRVYCFNNQDCKWDCPGAPNSPDCVECLDREGCIASFETCSGFTLETD